MKQLLERWSQLEPHLCKRETRPNKDWHELEDYYIQTEMGWQMVYTDMVAIGYDKVKKEAPAKVQWAVQQAIIEKGWNFTLNSFLGNFVTTVISPSYTISSSYKTIPESLLSAYLEVLSANP